MQKLNGIPLQLEPPSPADLLLVPVYATHTVSLTRADTLLLLGCSGGEPDLSADPSEPVLSGTVVCLRIGLGFAEGLPYNMHGEPPPRRNWCRKQQYKC